MGDTTLRELVYGKGAHVDPVACVEDISAELAARIAAGYPHSIWQIVEHMNYWMDYELAKIAGENPTYPGKAIESWPAHPSPANGDGQGTVCAVAGHDSPLHRFTGSAGPARGIRCGGARTKDSERGFATVSA